MDDNQFAKKDDDDDDDNNEFHKNDRNLINNLIIQLNDSIQEESNESIIECLNSTISYAELYPIPLNTGALSYNFITNLMNLFFSADVEKSNLVTKLLLKISFQPKSEIIEYLIENEYLEKILNCLTSIEDQTDLKIILQIVLNIVSDFSKASMIIYSNPYIIEFFIKTITDISNSNENIEKMIAILSIISGEDIEFKQKKPILDESIQFLKNEKYQQFWSLLLNIPDSMIINNEISKLIFDEMLLIFQEFLRSDDEMLLESTIRCIGKHFLYSNDYICIDFRKIMKCAESSNSDLSLISLWLLSNALACGPEMINEIEYSEPNGRIYKLLISFLQKDTKLRCKLEACRAMNSIIMQGSNEQIKKAIRFNFISTFVQVIEMQNVTFASPDGKNLVEETLMIINFLMNLKVIQMNDQSLKSKCKKQFHDCNGLEIIDELIHCDIENVSHAAQAFLDKYTEIYK